MDLLKKVWAWLDGKKTVIGAALDFIAYGLKGMGWIDDATFNGLLKVGEVIIAGGFLHKGIKMMQ